MKRNSTIGAEDASLFLVTDNIEEAVQLIIEKSIKQYGRETQKQNKTAEMVI